MNLEDLTEKEIEAIRRCAKLHNKAHEILENGPFDTITKFACPLCGCEAVAIKSAYNGHVHCRCENCNIRIME